MLPQELSGIASHDVLDRAEKAPRILLDVGFVFLDRERRYTLGVGARFGRNGIHLRMSLAISQHNVMGVFPPVLFFQLHIVDALVDIQERGEGDFHVCSQLV